jgi:hypothetical protein
MSCPRCACYYKRGYFNPETDLICPACIAIVIVLKSEEKICHLLKEGKDPTSELDRCEKLRTALEDEKKRSSDYDVTALHEGKHDDKEEKHPSPLEVLKSNSIDLLLSMHEWSHHNAIEKIAESYSGEEVTAILDTSMLKDSTSTLRAVFEHSPNIIKLIDSVQTPHQLQALQNELGVL